MRSSVVMFRKAVYTQEANRSRRFVFPLGINILDFPGPIHKQLVHAVCIHTALADCVESTTQYECSSIRSGYPGSGAANPQNKKIANISKGNCPAHV